MKISSNHPGRPPKATPAPPSSPSVRELIEKLSPEDTDMLLSILRNRENVRMISTLESKALLENLVKGEK